MHTYPSLSADSENLNSSSHSSSQNDVQAAATTKQDGTSRKSDNEDAAVSSMSHTHYIKHIKGII